MQLPNQKTTLAVSFSVPSTHHAQLTARFSQEFLMSSVLMSSHVLRHAKEKELTRSLQLTHTKSAPAHGLWFVPTHSGNPSILWRPAFEACALANSIKNIQTHSKTPKWPSRLKGHSISFQCLVKMERNGTWIKIPVVGRLYGRMDGLAQNGLERMQPPPLANIY